MKIEIKEIKKVHGPWKPDGKSWTMYSWDTVSLIDGKTEFVRIKTFSDKIQIAEGIVIQENVEPVGTIEIKDNPKGYKEASIKTMKKEYKGGGGMSQGGKFQSFKKMTMQDYVDVINFCNQKSTELAGENAELRGKFFIALLENCCDHVEPEQGGAVDEAAKKIENVFSDEQIPF